VGEVIANTEIPRDPKCLYYCGTDEKGNITLCKAVMARGGKGKDKKKVNKGKKK